MADSLSIHAYLTQLYDYNNWSNQRYLSVAASLSPEQLFHDHAQSWGSIYGVLEHVVIAEWLWLQRCKGSSPKSYPSQVANPTIEDLGRRYDDLEGELHSFLAAQTDQSLLQEINYINTKGIAYHLLLWQILAHVANHGTHHRGELAAMFAILGIPHPEEDWFLYFLERNGQRKA